MTKLATEMRMSWKEETPNSLKAQTKTFYDDKHRKFEGHWIICICTNNYQKTAHT